MMFALGLRTLLLSWRLMPWSFIFGKMRTVLFWIFLNLSRMVLFLRWSLLMILFRLLSSVSRGGLL